MDLPTQRRGRSFLELLTPPRKTSPASMLAPGDVVMGRLSGLDAWAPSGGAGPPVFPDAPADGDAYGRRNAAWIASVMKDGDTLRGFLSLYDDPTDAAHAATKRYVDRAVASGDLYQGTWAVGANDPPLDPLPSPAPPNGARWLCLTADPLGGEFPPAGMPGIGGRQIFSGDFVVWDVPLAKWELLHTSSSLTKDLTDTYYLSLNGGTMTGPITLPGTPGLALQAVPRGYVDAQDALRTLKSGDTFLGPLTLTPLQQTLDNHAATIGQLRAVEAAADERVLKAGDTMTGLLALSGPPIGNLDAATKLYVDQQRDTRVLKAGDTMTGHLNLGPAATVKLSLQPVAAGDAVPKNYCDNADALRVLKTGDTMTGTLNFRTGPNAIYLTVQRDTIKYFQLQRLNGLLRWDINTGNDNDDSFDIRAVTNAGTNYMTMSINRQSGVMRVPYGVQQSMTLDENVGPAEYHTGQVIEAAFARIKALERKLEAFVSSSKFHPYSGLGHV
jgi:hypothetical protein